MTGAEFGRVDIDLLADYIGGALSGTPEESVVAARIADDPGWREAYASLHDGMAFVTAELGRLQPGPMPADLVARLDAALATPALDPDLSGRLDFLARESEPRESGLEASEQRRTEPGASEPGGTEPEAGEPGASEPEVSEPGMAGPRAGAASVPGPNDGAITDAEPIAAGLAQPPAPHLTLVHGDLAGGDVPNPVRKKAPGRRLRWAAPIAVAAGVVAFVGFGLDYLAGRSQSNNDASSAGMSQSQKQAEGPSLARPPLVAGRVLASGTDYTHATLGTAAAKQMTAPFATTGGSPQVRGPVPDVAAGDSALQRLTAPDELEKCLDAIERQNAAGAISVQSVDFARFSGAPAVIVRFVATNGNWVWASGAGCGTSASGAATLDKVPVG